MSVLTWISNGFSVYFTAPKALTAGFAAEGAIGKNAEKIKNACQGEALAKPGHSEQSEESI